MNTLQKAGGVAALLHGAAYLISMAVGIAIMFPLLDATTRQYLAFVADHQTLVYLWNLIAYWGSAATLVVMALALHERMKAGAPALTQTATVFGLIWAALIIGSGNLMLHDIGVIANLYSKNPAQAETIWLALQAAENGIVSGNELVGSLWVLLLSLAAVRMDGMPKSLGYFGVALSVAGILTMIPPLTESMIMVFGPGMIVWSVWVGVVLLRTRPIGNERL